MNIARFEHIEFLYALVLLIPLLLFFLLRLRWRNRVIRTFGDEQLVLRLIRGLPRYKPQIKFTLMGLSFVSLIFALANLQFGSKMEKVKRQGIDLVIALDLSRSMLSEDVTPNRLERSKQFIYRLIDKLEGDRIGIVVFAGNAYVQMPVTVDHSAARLFLSNLNTSLIPTQGTAISDALNLSLEMFESAEKKYKTLVIISDGEDHEGDVDEAVKSAKEEGVIVHTVGVGTSKGAPVPVYRNNRQVDYQRDKDGSIILSKLNDEMLQQIASKGDGSYFRINNSGDDLKALVKQLNSQEDKEIDSRVVTNYQSQFQFFLLLSLMLLLIEFLIFERKSRLNFSFKNLILTKHE